MVTQIEVTSFRGIKGSLTLNLGKSANNRPPVLLLHGDNGTGKSSIIDAIEFGLQSRIHRRAGLSNPETPYVLPLGATSGFVKVYFEDNTSVERSIEINSKTGNIHAVSNRAHENYRIAPFVLRRSDILSFWDTPEHQRQIVFTDVALGSSQEEALDDSHVERLAEFERERTKLKSERRRYADRLAYELKLAAVEVPLEANPLSQFVKQHIYGGLDKQQRQAAIKRGDRIERINTEALRMAKAIERLVEPIKTVNAHIAKLSKVNTGNPRLRAVRDLLKSAEIELTTAFKEICTSSELIDKVEIVTGNIGKVDLSISVKTVDGHQIDPRRMFSEANRDLLAFLVFLTIIHEAGQKGQGKTLVLDDVFQSVDAGIRLRVAEYIFRQFADWQLIITTHDRLWHQQLRALTVRNGRPLTDYTVLRWEPNIGPIIIGATVDAESRLKKALQEGDTIGICANGGLLLELLCQELTVNLATSVTRRPGDQYTLGDMWPSLAKALKKSSLKPQAENVERGMLLRNLVGAHYNAWAQNVSLTEASGFGNSVLDLVTETKCMLCSTFLRISHKWQGLKCTCGNLAVEDYKG